MGAGRRWRRRRGVRASSGTAAAVTPAAGEHGDAAVSATGARGVPEIVEAAAAAAAAAAVGYDSLTGDRVASWHSSTDEGVSL